jgi:hypothetical protein
MYLPRTTIHTEIERLTKSFRGHRCALYFDLGFVNSVLKEEVLVRMPEDHGEEIERSAIL